MAKSGNTSLAEFTILLRSSRRVGGRVLPAGTAIADIIPRHDAADLPLLNKLLASGQAEAAVYVPHGGNDPRE